MLLICDCDYNCVNLYLDRFTLSNIVVVAVAVVVVVVAVVVVVV